MFFVNTPHFNGKGFFFSFLFYVSGRVDVIEVDDYLQHLSKKNDYPFFLLFIFMNKYG